MSSFALLVFVTSIEWGQSREQQLVIKEVCPHNDTVSYDKIGRYSDYIVISNISDEIVNLEGFCLSDDKTDLNKFYFPAMDILPHDDITVRATTLEWYHHGLIDREDLFAGFSLRDGEQLFLVAPNGTIEDEVILPTLGSDMTYIFNGYEREIRTSRKEETSDIIISDDIDLPSFSQNPGFYNNAIVLQINCKPGEEIYYSLFGENPYKSGIRYTGPIKLTDPSLFGDRYANTRNIVIDDDCYYPPEPVDKAVVVRAIVKGANGEYSRENVGTYFIGEHMSESYSGNYVISMVTDPDALFSDDHGIYVSGQIWENNRDRIRQIESEELDYDITEMYPANFLMKGTGWRRDANIEIFDNIGIVEDSFDALISIRGNSSRFKSQKSFNIFPDDSNTNLSIKHGYEDTTGIKEELTGKLAEGLKVSVQSSRCCQLFLDGEYWGTYSIQDKLDKDLVAREYGISRENIDFVKDYGFDSDSITDNKQFEGLVDAIYSSDMTREEDYDKICSIVDIGSLIDFYCMEIILNNEDFAVHNYVIWRARKQGDGEYEDGKWRFWMYDEDCTMQEPYNDLLSTILEGGTFSYDMLAILYQNEDFRNSFNNRMLELCNNEFAYDRISTLINEVGKEYMNPMIHSYRRFEDADYDEIQYMEEIRKIKEFFKLRVDYIRKICQK